ncbi:Papilin Precursor [Triplophysa tibetana]|uniref:Papilin n=1 Tax=Triplophysa tibetana TaxID=1572043 RepID=A0A5A9PMS7_9TELE|nr:Papilin Precursor [Triplophysa tibetana]
MQKSNNRKLSLCQTLNLITVLLSPGCLSSKHFQSSRKAEGVEGTQMQSQLHFINEWASWGGWSVCSRSCGGGASVRTRTCITRNLVGGPCPGDTRQYKICNTKECEVGSVDFRELQCKAFNDRPLVAGNRYHWMTFHGGSDPCELSCLAIGHNFYYNFGRVLDGTPCQSEQGTVCVNRKCNRPGCDLIFGSQQREDACMVCGGHNSTCLYHRNVYHSNGQNNGLFGYSEVTMIPAGATHIKVTDNSNNYLALQNGRSQFVINGNWKISVPGEYSVAGTKLLYRRSADTWESFEVSGPTQEDLHIMVLSTDKNSGIEYEYWLPPDSYALHHGRSQLRLPQHTDNYLPFEPSTISSTTTTTTTTTHQPAVKPPFWGHCGKCRRVRGKGERHRQYCQKDFVFRAKVLEKVYHGQETRFDVQIIHTYRNRYRMEHREFLWAPNKCDCPYLEVGHQYILMLRRHINYERTLNRILLDEDSYVQPYRAREDSLLRPLEGLCGNRGTRT